MCCGGGGGGGSGTQTVETTTTNLPEYAQPYYEHLLQRGVYESARPYEAFPGQRLAQFSPYESQAMQGIASLGTPGQIGQATQLATSVGNQPIGGGQAIAGMFNPQAISPTYTASNFQAGYTPGTFAPGYTAGQLGPGFTAGSFLEPGSIQSYMSPYQQAVVDVEKREARRASEMMSPQIQAQAAGAGGLGGTRNALLQAERERNLSQQMADIQTRGSQAAFDQAARLFEADRAARLQEAQYGLGAFGAQEGARQRQAELNFGAQQAADQARQRAAELGLSAQQQTEAARQAQQEFLLNAQQFNVEQQRQRALLGLSGLETDQQAMAQRLAAAQLLGGFGEAQQSMDLQRLQAMMAAGATERQLAQMGLDIGYQDFLRQQAYPREQLGFLSALLQGVPIQPGSTQAVYGATPSTAQQLLGSGIGSLGLYRILQGG